MENISPKNTGFQNPKELKTKKVELPVTIFTEFPVKVGDEEGEAIQQIEKAVFCLIALFNSIKNSATLLEGEAKTGSRLAAFCDDLMNLSEVGYGLNNSILRSLMVFDKTNQEAISEIDLLATQISGILSNPNLPNPIQRGFDKAMVDFINSQLDLDEFNDDMNSPEYIARHLKAYGGENV